MEFTATEQKMSMSWTEKPDDIIDILTTRYDNVQEKHTKRVCMSH